DLDDLPDMIRKMKQGRKKFHHDLLDEWGLLEEAVHGYLACVSYADAMLGRVLDALEASPYRDNTIVVIWSDHGYHQGQKGDWGKHTLWERTTNVPFIWSGPGISKGQSVDATVSLIDMFPTFVETCGLAEDPGLEGVSLASVLKDPSSATDRDVLVPWLQPNAFAIINQDWRYIHYQDGSEELYDLNNDPNEWHNLAENPEFAAIKAELKSSAPEEQAPAGVNKTKLKLVIEGESFRWEAQ
ncbi:MAG: sulfatase-like hydrolase/transferase, partial [Coraliomargarita sp.]